jgi:hypothetical protein
VLRCDGYAFPTWSGRVESYVTTDGQSASLSWNKAPIWGLRPEFYYCRTVAGFVDVGALSDERTVLSFTIAAGSRQSTHFLGPSPVGLVIIFYCFGFETSNFVASYDSQGYGGGIRPRPHTASDLVVKVTLRLTVGQSVSKSWCRAPSGADDQIFITV